METLVVRVWMATEAASAPVPGELHGFVEHVGCGRCEAFQTAADLLALIRAEVSADAARRRGPQAGSRGAS